MAICWAQDIHIHPIFYGMWHSDWPSQKNWARTEHVNVLLCTFNQWSFTLMADCTHQDTLIYFVLLLQKYHDIWRNKLIAYIDLDSPSKGRKHLESDIGDHVAITSSASVEVLINLIIKQVRAFQILSLLCDYHVLFSDAGCTVDSHYKGFSWYGKVVGYILIMLHPDLIMLSIRDSLIWFCSLGFWFNWHYWSSSSAAAAFKNCISELSWLLLVRPVYLNISIWHF